MCLAGIPLYKTIPESGTHSFIPSPRSRGFRFVGKDEKVVSTVCAIVSASGYVIAISFGWLIDWLDDDVGKEKDRSAKLRLALFPRVRYSATATS